MPNFNVNALEIFQPFLGATGFEEELSYLANGNLSGIQEYRDEASCAHHVQSI